MRDDQTDIGHCSHLASTAMDTRAVLLSSRIKLQKLTETQIKYFRQEAVLFLSLAASIYNWLASRKTKQH